MPARGISELSKKANFRMKAAIEKVRSLEKKVFKQVKI